MLLVSSAARLGLTSVAIYTHFESKFRQQAQQSGRPEDIDGAWTLKVLSKVISAFL